MKYFAVLYKYNPGSPEIADVRPAHREFIARLNDEGKILGSGPFTDSEGGALIVLQLADSAELSNAIELMDFDPFFQHHLITHRSIREWKPVINSFAS